ncbi:uncharacterized protein LOC111253252 isoform X3 [Varroa destructor]|nr:uncharacterized protein LOC111253252 isoform X3 [Varroa destructor]XP_022668131.1 uncharacterized protein LOC111253252 isoform X3 [Varroa destructor]
MQVGRRRGRNLSCTCDRHSAGECFLSSAEIRLFGCPREMQRRSTSSTPGGVHQPQQQSSHMHGGVCSNDDLLANLHLSEVINAQGQSQDHQHGTASPQGRHHRQPCPSLSQKQQRAVANQQQQPQQHNFPQTTTGAGPAEPRSSPRGVIGEPLRSDTQPGSEPCGAMNESSGQLHREYQQEQVSVKYGELVLLGYNGSLPDGAEKGRRRSKYVLSRRSESNGVRAARHVSAADPAASAAVLDALQHSIAYTLSRHQAVVVLYERDPTTDMFQIGRSKESQIDFVVMDTPPPQRTIIDDAQQTAQQQQLEQHINRRHQTQQQQPQRNGDFRSGISRYACRLLVERQARKCVQRNRKVQKNVVDKQSSQGILQEDNFEQNERRLHSDNEKCSSREYSSGEDDENVDEWVVRVFAAGFDSSSNIFLGENASAWQGSGGAIDGLTTNGVLLMQPMGEFGELPAAVDGSSSVAGAAGIWREVSVAGGVYGLRESRAARRAGPRIAGEKNVLYDGALIDLCGATLLFRSARGLRNSPTRAELLEQTRESRQRSEMSKKSLAVKTAHATAAAGNGIAGHAAVGENDETSNTALPAFNTPNAAESGSPTPATIGKPIAVLRSGANPTGGGPQQVPFAQVTSSSSLANAGNNGSNYVRSISVSSATGGPDRPNSALKMIPLSARRGFSIESLSGHEHQASDEDGAFSFSTPMGIVKSGEKATEEYKHEHRKISTSNIRKIMKDGVIQETHETTNQQVKKLQAGDLHYHEARHTQQVRDKLEGDGYSAERVAGKRQDRKVLTCGEQSKESNMDAKALSTRLVTAEGTIDEIAMAKQRETRHFNKGHLQEQYNDGQIAASRTVANAATGVLSKVSVSHRQPVEGGTLSPLVTSPDGGQCLTLQSKFNCNYSIHDDGPPSLLSTNKYAGITRQVQDEFRQLESQPADASLAIVIASLHEHIRVFIERLKDSCNVEESIEILQAMVVIVKSAWSVPTYCHELGFEVCNVLRETSGLAHLVKLCDEHINKNSHDRHLQDKLTFEAASLIEQSLSTENRAYIVANGIDKVVRVAIQYASSASADKKTRVGTGILCHLFKHSESTCSYLLENKALELIIQNCKTTDVRTLRNCATAFANLAIYGGAECQKIMVDQRRSVPIWLFPLAFHKDYYVTYWACLAVSVLAANHEIEAVVRQSDTLDLVEMFCNTRDPEAFARSNLAHVYGQSKDWLQRFVPVLSSRLKQACSLAAFHFAMEASIKRQQGNTGIFSEIGAVDALKRVASSPNDLASKFAARALRIIGEKLPQALSQQVPLWRELDVQQWVKQIGFGDRAQAFLDAKVDGDLLLQIDETMLENDIGINKQLLRKRFLRELRKLKQMADYSSVDSSNVAQVLSNIDAEFTQYTYGFLRSGVDKSALSRLTEEQLQKECGIDNSVHRKKILSYLAKVYPCPSEVESSEDSKKCIDAFISYRRSTGSQLASLLKVHLQLKGFTVFIDVERLEAGKFDNNLLNSIRQARSFILVLTTGALERCKNDIDRKDWVHREIVEAIEADCNIIPITDNFGWPDVNDLPEDIRPILYYNAINWIHDYQDACVDKIERFIRGDRQANEKAGTATPDSLSGKGWAYGTRSGSLDLDRAQMTAQHQTILSEEQPTMTTDQIPAQGQQQFTVEMPQSPPLTD